jgi:hypothetical protein
MNEVVMIVSGSGEIEKFFCFFFGCEGLTEKFVFIVQKNYI